MALHLNGFKNQKWSKGAHSRAIPFLGDKERRKGEKSLGLKKIKFWLGFFPFSCSFVINQLRSGDLKRLR